MNAFIDLHSNPSVFILILNWNGYKDTLECINSISKINYRNYKIVLIDNGSDSNEIDNIVVHFPEVKLIKNEKNLGFTGGNNLGIEYSIKMNAEFILLLNNDTTVEPDFLEPLLSVFENCRETGIAAPQINYYNEPQRIWTTGGKISRIRGSGFAYSDQIENEPNKIDKEVSFVSGCCMLIKKEVFEQIGLFDEKFFLYIEDTDLCFRARNAGYKIIVSLKSIIYHKVGRTAGNKLDQIPLYYVTRNRLYFAKKNFRKVYLVTVVYLFTTMIFKSLTWFLRGKYQNILSVKRAFQDFFKDNMGKTDHSRLKSIR